MKYKIYIKYLFSGGTSTGVHFSLLYLLHGWLGLWIVLATSLAFTVAFFVSFYLQKFWTFRDNRRERMFRQMFLYLSVGLVNLALNATAMYFLVDRYHIWYMLAQAMVAGTIACESFLVYRTFIFKIKPATVKTAYEAENE